MGSLKKTLTKNPKWMKPKTRPAVGGIVSAIKAKQQKKWGS